MPTTSTSVFIAVFQTVSLLLSPQKFAAENRRSCRVTKTRGIIQINNTHFFCSHYNDRRRNKTKKVCKDSRETYCCKVSFDKQRFSLHFVSIYSPRYCQQNRAHHRFCPIEEFKNMLGSNKIYLNILHMNAITDCVQLTHHSISTKDHMREHPVLQYDFQIYSCCKFCARLNAVIFKKPTSPFHQTARFLLVRYNCTSDAHPVPENGNYTLEAF